MEGCALPCEEENGGAERRAGAGGRRTGRGEKLRAERAGRAGRRVADPQRGETPARGTAVGGCGERTHNKSGGGGKPSGEVGLVDQNPTAQYI